MRKWKISGIFLAYVAKLTFFLAECKQASQQRPSSAHGVQAAIRMYSIGKWGETIYDKCIFSEVVHKIPGTSTGHTHTKWRKGKTPSSSKLKRADRRYSTSAFLRV